MREGFTVRIIFILISPAVSHFTGRSHLAADDVSKSISGFHTWLHDLEKCFDICIFIHKGEICQTTCIDCNDHMFVHAADISELFLLFFCQIIISGFVKAVCTFSRNTAENIDCNICISFGNRCTCRHSEWCCGIYVKKSQYFILKPGCFFFNLITPCISGFLIFFIEILNPVFCCNHKSSIFHSLIDTDGFTFVDITGTSSAFNCSGRTYAIESYLCSFFQRKNSFIFQEYHSFCRCSSGNLTVVQFSFGYCIICCSSKMSCLNDSHFTVSSSTSS